MFYFFLMILRPPRSTRTYTLFPYTTLFLSTARDSGVPAADPQERARLVHRQLQLRRDPRQSGRRWRVQHDQACDPRHDRSEEHTSELQSLMRNSYAVFCLKKKKNTETDTKNSKENITTTSTTTTHTSI